jgi:hypothetical protein
MATADCRHRHSESSTADVMTGSRPTSAAQPWAAGRSSAAQNYSGQRPRRADMGPRDLFDRDIRQVHLASGR